MRGLAIAIAIGIGCGHSTSNAPVDAIAPSPDATHDAAMLQPDASSNASTDTPAVPCTGSAGDVYAVAAQANAALGAILACAPADVLDEATVGSDVGSAMTVTSAVKTYLVAYETRDGSGNPAVSTARPVPIVVAAHGSVGLADSCVPSLGLDDNLPLPYAGRGFAAIAPDFAGLGNAGTQDYLNQRAQGWQLLDGARALRALLAPGVTAQDLILSGYSQGGGAAISAQSLIKADGEGIGQLVATVVYAPEWPESLNNFGYANILDNPTELTIETGLSYSSVAVLRQYAYFENHVGSGMGVTAEPSQFASGLQTAVQSQCLVGVGAYIQINMLHLSDLIDPTLRTDLLACIASEGPEAGCSGNAEAYYNFLLANEVPPDPTEGPILLVQGLDDLIMPAASEAACNYATLQSAGMDVDTCVFASADHTDIMDQHPSGVAWAESVLAGGARAECDQSSQLPACSQ
jgi:pimeloyl-ACP methyl ester carboxylesterase